MDNAAGEGLGYKVKNERSHAPISDCHLRPVLQYQDHHDTQIIQILSLPLYVLV
jgi:hypothetical protein